MAEIGENEPLIASHKWAKNARKRQAKKLGRNLLDGAKAVNSAVGQAQVTKVVTEPIGVLLKLADTGRNALSKESAGAKVKQLQSLKDVTEKWDCDGDHIDHETVRDDVLRFAIEQLKKKASGHTKSKLKAAKRFFGIKSAYQKWGGRTQQANWLLEHFWARNCELADAIVHVLIGDDAMDVLERMMTEGYNDEELNLYESLGALLADKLRSTS